jgi:hypothetical protein
MSSSAGLPATGTLIVEAGLGVAVEVLNGASASIYRGADATRLEVDPGLYAVRWTSFDEDSRTLVEVQAGDVTLVRSELQALAKPTDSAIAAVASVPSLPQSPTTSAKVDTSDLIVTVEGPKKTDLSGLMASFSVVDVADKVVDAFADPTMVPAEGMVAWADVTSGRYRLRFASTSGEIIDQTIGVLRNRRTIVRMVASHATAMVPDGTGFKPTKTLGIDPSRTVITSVAPSDDQVRIEEQVRFASILIRDIAASTGSLSEAFVAELNRPKTDPLIRMYGALVILNCLERATTPTLDRSYPADPRKVSKFKKEWLALAERWLSSSRRAGMPPDATAGRWQIERLNRPRAKTASPESFGSIQMPPMLECAWHWAIARSTTDRHALKGFANIRAAARSAGGTTPWLCWKAEAAKAINDTSATPSTRALDRLVHEVAIRSKELRERSERSSSIRVLPDWIPADVATMALRAEEVIDGQAKSRSSPQGHAAALAIALALPLPAVATKLKQSVKVLADALEHGPPKAKSKVDREAQDAPGWIKGLKEDKKAQKKRKKPKNRDPNKGRFGGLSERDGFRIEADFKMTNSKNWASIFLRVSGPAPDGETAVVYLHPSFTPIRKEIQFDGGEARLKRTAWGGFTVGVWIPHAKVELELDLGLVHDAPRIIRER